jgi:hypothetical protein
VKQDLIAEIHRISIWPVFVKFEGNISKHSKTDFIDGDGGYIILILDGIFKSFQVAINELAQEGEHKFLRLWTSEARFVVAGLNEFSMSQQKAIQVFDYFSQLRIYN